MRFEQDGWIMDEEVETVFQFSLWDSCKNSTLHKRRACDTFNSLYEIPRVQPELFRQGILLQLSILFMRFWDTFGPHETPEVSFNSLYEIPRRKVESVLVEVPSFQFSLWDSMSRLNLLELIVQRSLSILFMRFSKINVAHFPSKYLSILFMRFCNRLGWLEAWTCLLLILFMRFQALLFTANLVIWVSFQFSLWDSFLVRIISVSVC